MKRGTAQFLILSIFFAVCFAQLSLDQSLDGSLDTIVETTFPIPNKPDLNEKPETIPLPDDLANTNNLYLKNHGSVAIAAVLALELANKTAEQAIDDAREVIEATFMELRGYLEDLVNRILNDKDSFNPDVQDFNLVARHHLRALIARFRARKLAKFLMWYEKHHEFSLRRVAIRNLRLQLLEKYKNCTTIVEGLIAGGCIGLPALGISTCDVGAILDGAANLASQELQNLIDSATADYNNLTSLINSYKTDLETIVSFFTDVDPEDDNDKSDYAAVLEALKARRNFELPTWEQVVEKLQNLLNTDAEFTTLKRLIKSLWVGWKLGLDGNTITCEKKTPVDPRNPVIDLEFTVLLSKDDNNTESEDEGALKLQAAIKTVLQTYAWIDRLLCEPVTVDGAGIAHVIVHIRFFELDNLRQLAQFYNNVKVPDQSLFQNEFNDFVTALSGDLNTLKDTVNQTLQNLTSNFRKENDDAQTEIGLQIERRAAFFNNASVELSAFANNTNNLVIFAQKLVLRYVAAVNQTVNGLKAAVASIKAAILEADARIQVLKQQAIELATQIQASVDAQATVALTSALDNVKDQIKEALQDREIKRQVIANATALIDAVLERAQTELANLQANVQSLANNVKKALTEIKTKIKSSLQDFEESVKNAFKAYRQSLNELNITAGADLNVNDNLSLTFTVSIADSGAEGEDVTARVKIHLALLKAIFATITTDANIQVSSVAKRASNDVYTVQSGQITPTPTPTTSPAPTPTTSPAPTPTTSPAPTPTNPSTGGANTIAMSFFALIACLLMLF